MRPALGSEQARTDTADVTTRCIARRRRLPLAWEREMGWEVAWWARIAKETLQVWREGVIWPSDELLSWRSIGGYFFFHAS